MDMTDDFKVADLSIVDESVKAASKKQAVETLAAVQDHHDEIDAKISENLDKWSIDRIAKTDLAILRTAVAEMLYVDSIPSHMLPFMQEMEELCRGNGLRLKVYVIANNGFIEGKQNEPLMQVMENFCARSGLTWCGGIGFGGGVMLNVERIMITVMFGLMLLNVLLSAVQGGDVLDPVLSFGKSLLGLVILACGIIAFGIRLAVHINRGTDAGKKYTRIMLPSFVFIAFADIFFIIVSVLQGGIFRGWLSRFQPDAGCSLITENGK
jgi:hypothetical protein